MDPAGPASHHLPAEEASRMNTTDTSPAPVLAEARGERERAPAPTRLSPVVLIASPGPSLRTRLKECLEGLPTHEVAQWEALDRTISSLLPPVVILDLELLAAAGIRDLSILRRVCRKAKILLLSGRLRDEEAIDGLKAGARGYCGRDAAPPVLRKAVEKIREGEIWAERRLIPLFIAEYERHPEDRPELRVRPDRRLALLTPREMEIARLIGAGASNRDIAVRLMVGEGTVKAHLTAIFRKLGFTDRLKLGLFLAGPDSKPRRRH
jgi:two-component system, NarL family, nitrate/nitrite response regulator NarL